MGAPRCSELWLMTGRRRACAGRGAMALAGRSRRLRRGRGAASERFSSEGALRRTQAERSEAREVAQGDGSDRHPKKPAPELP